VDNRHSTLGRRASQSSQLTPTRPARSRGAIQPQDDPEVVHRRLRVSGARSAFTGRHPAGVPLLAIEEQALDQPVSSRLADAQAARKAAVVVRDQAGLGAAPACRGRQRACKKPTRAAGTHWPCLAPDRQPRPVHAADAHAQEPDREVPSRKPLAE